MQITRTLKRMGWPSLMAAASFFGCHAKLISLGSLGSDGGNPSGVAHPGDNASAGTPTGDAANGGGPSPRSTANKIDLLFVVDNSTDMPAEQTLLAQSVPYLLERLLVRICVDAAGNLIEQAPAGDCPLGHTEVPPVNDMHIGIVTSSLGGRGGDQCPADGKDPANLSLSAHGDD